MKSFFKLISPRPMLFCPWTTRTTFFFSFLASFNAIHVSGNTQWVKKISQSSAKLYIVSKLLRMLLLSVINSGHLRYLGKDKNLGRITRRFPWDSSNGISLIPENELKKSMNGKIGNGAMTCTSTFFDIATANSFTKTPRNGLTWFGNVWQRNNIFIRKLQRLHKWGGGQFISSSGCNDTAIANKAGRTVSINSVSNILILFRIPYIINRRFAKISKQDFSLPIVAT